MKVLPAIDLKDGECVRLRKGDYGTAHKVAADACETARGFIEAGAELIHMVDLDGAKDGTRANYDVVKRVIKETGALVELGGGIRSMDDIDAVLSLGAKRVIIGSAAVENPELVKEAVEKYGDKIAVGIDAKNGTVRTEGWLKDSKEDFILFAGKMEGMGVRALIFTDIDRDGMLEGPNFEQLKKLRETVKCELVASGGVSTIEDVKSLKALGIDAAIAGKAIYTGALDLAEAVREGR